MGTNFYTKINHCNDCGRYDEIHLGKSSYGWKFCFQLNGEKFYKNVDEMRDWLKYKEIKDEYGATISKEDFWKMVEEKQNGKNSEDEIIIDGYSFINREFS